jgi:sporulation protein YlmC with PRC-barrel domain
MYELLTIAGPSSTLMGAGTLMGNAVFNQQYEDLGEVKEIMLVMRTGKLGYAALARYPP